MLQSDSIIQSHVNVVSIWPVLVRLPLASLHKFCQHHNCLDLETESNKDAKNKKFVKKNYFITFLSMTNCQKFSKELGLGAEAAMNSWFNPLNFIKEALM